ncbi:MAG: hypothetical protein IJX11_04020 [Bacteroidales bacterium]|nr:hypothetical protein [Bacteroidales bacterium]
MDNFNSLEAQICAIVEKHRNELYPIIEKYMCSALDEVGALLAEKGLSQLPQKTISGLSNNTIRELYRMRLDDIHPSAMNPVRKKECLLEFLKINSIRYDIISSRYPNYLKPWKPEDDMKLESLWCEGKSIAELSDIFQRNPGAIESRIGKLELTEKYGPRK